MLEDKGVSLIVAQKQMGDEDWAGLWRRLEKSGCDLWNWRKSYFDPEIMDGTQWELKIRKGGRKLKSHGSNAFPGGDEEGNEFDLFLGELQSLLGVG